MGEKKAKKRETPAKARELATLYATTLYYLYLGCPQSEPPQEDMRRHIHYPTILNSTQISLNMPLGAKIQLFKNINTRSIYVYE